MDAETIVLSKMSQVQKKKSQVVWSYTSVESKIVTSFLKNFHFIFYFYNFQSKHGFLLDGNIVLF